MNRNIIQLKDVLKIMDSKREVSFTYVTADRKRKTGGEIITIDRAIQTGDYKESPIPKSNKVLSRNPSHGAHSTRNFILLPSKQTRKVNIRLITEFEGRRVIY